MRKFVTEFLFCPDLPKLLNLPSAPFYSRTITNSINLDVDRTTKLHPGFSAQRMYIGSFRSRNLCFTMDRDLQIFKE